MAKRVSASSLRKTRNFDFLFGSYSLSEKVIPYFQISMTFNDASEYLRLIDNLPGASSINWQIEELFQRDIDWDRVQKGLVPYLSDSERPQFFNALTVALIPRKGDTFHGDIKECEWNPPTLDNSGNFAQFLESGPIKVGYWEEWDTIESDRARTGQISWNQDEIVAVAIDGQHRLAAIKEISQRSPHKKAAVPVILLVFDEALGFRGAGSNYTDIIMVLRRLFIDLNKNARTVKRARQILLDDRDPVSICVRRIIGNQLMVGAEELKKIDPVIPLTLIDWHTEQAKFEDGPYLTTILGLDWIVSQLLGIKPVESGVDYLSFNRNIKSLKRNLSIDLDAALSRLDECEKLDKPFNYTEGEDDNNNELKSIADGFTALWVKPIIKILTEFEPYETLINDRAHSITLCPEFANWYSLRYNLDSTKSKATYLRGRMSDLELELKQRDNNPIDISEYIMNLELFNMHKANNKLAFTVVFQRAMFLAFKYFSNIKDYLAPINEFDSKDLSDTLSADDFEDDANDIDVKENTINSNVQLLDKRAEEFVSVLNALYSEEPGILDPNYEYSVLDTGTSERFWQGSFCLPDGTIDYTQAASTRGSLLIIALAVMSLIRKYDENNNFEEMLEKASTSSAGLYPKFNHTYHAMGKPNSIGDRILKNRELPESERTESDCLKLIAPRLKWMWTLLDRFDEK